VRRMNLSIGRVYNQYANRAGWYFDCLARSLAAGGLGIHQGKATPPAVKRPPAQRDTALFGHGRRCSVVQYSQYSPPSRLATAQTSPVSRPRGACKHGLAFVALVISACSVTPGNSSNGAGNAVDKNAEQGAEMTKSDPAAVSDTDFLNGLAMPEGAIGPVDAAKNALQVSALKTLVETYIKDRFTISAARNFTVAGRTPAYYTLTSFYAYWRKSIAKDGQPIKPGGGPPSPSWAPQPPTDAPYLYLHINFYPAQDDRPAFIVAVARDVLPDGTRLVGYYALAPIDRK
jgi:hypothetical protein